MINPVNIHGFMNNPLYFYFDPRSGTIDGVTALQAGKSRSSIPDDVIGIFHWHNPSGRTVTPGLTQPLTDMGTRNISWGVKAAGA